MNDLPVLTQIRIAFRRDNWLALLIACAVALAPVAAFATKVWGMDPSQPFLDQVAGYIVLGGFIYSSTTVWAWMRRVLRSGDGRAAMWLAGAKAAAFCVVIEGAVLWGGVEALSWVALLVITAINAAAVASNTAMDQERYDAAQAERVKVEKAAKAAAKKKTGARRTHKTKAPSSAMTRRLPELVAPAALPGEEAPKTMRSSVG